MKLKAVREGASELWRRFAQGPKGLATSLARHYGLRTPRKHDRGAGGKRARVCLISSVSSVMIGLAAWAVWEIPAGTLLRQSFTRLPDRYTELYFFSPPSVNSGIVTVPIALIDHGDDSVLQLRILVRDTSGRATAQTTTSVQPRRDVPVTFFVLLPETQDQSQVQVDLLNHPQTLHYRIGSPTARARPSARGGHVQMGDA